MFCFLSLRTCLSFFSLQGLLDFLVILRSLSLPESNPVHLVDGVGVFVLSLYRGFKTVQYGSRMCMTVVPEVPGGLRKFKKAQEGSRSVKKCQVD